MKKLITLVVAIALTMSLTIPAFAASTLNNTGASEPIPVKAEFKAGQKKPLYSVNISWDSMTFTYTEDNYTWYPDTHTYSDPTGNWDRTSSKITVINHSNVDVAVSLAFEAGSGFTGDFDNTGATLTAGVVNEPESADKKEFTFSLKSWPKQMTDKDTAIGTITVTIN